MKEDDFLINRKITGRILQVLPIGNRTPLHTQEEGSTAIRQCQGYRLRKPIEFTEEITQ